MPKGTKIERYVIQEVKKKRKALKMSQVDLSHSLDLDSSFVGHVENTAKRDKYNLNHINALAAIFNCSPRDFLPEKAV